MSFVSSIFETKVAVICVNDAVLCVGRRTLWQWDLMLCCMCCLSEEDRYDSYSRMLLKYFLAEGVVCGHELYVASALDHPNDILQVCVCVRSSCQSVPLACTSFTIRSLWICSPWCYGFQELPQQWCCLVFGGFEGGVCWGGWHCWDVSGYITLKGSRAPKAVSPLGTTGLIVGGVTT